MPLYQNLRTVIQLSMRSLDSTTPGAVPEHGAVHATGIPNCHAEPTRDRERLCVCVLREYLRYLHIWQLWYCPEKPGDPIRPRFAEAKKALPTVNYLLDCLLENDRLLARETAEVLCREGYL